MNPKKMVKSKVILQLFILLVSCHLMSAYALMPETTCDSICKPSNKTLPIGSHCITQKNHTFYYRSLGDGLPTMIFSSGTGFPADGWFESGLATEMAKKIKVLAYDRIYTFNSCPYQNDYMPNTAKEVINQMHQFLKQEKVNPPYVLVGHSFGGLYMLMYARKYPTEVAGLVLMDATTDDGPTPLPKEAEKILKQLGNPQNPVPENPLYNEMIGQLPSYLQSKDGPALPKNIPLIVMYATKHCLPIELTKKLMCMNPSQEKNHQLKQIEIYNMSNKHRLIRVEGDHNSFFTKEKYSIVIEALNSILQIPLKGKKTE